MSTSRLISAAQKNPFVGTHTRPLLHNTTKAVDLALTRSTLSKERRGKNIFDYALRYKDLGHPYLRNGKAWGVLTWKGKLWHSGEERRINAASVRKWRCLDEEAESRAPTLSAPKVYQPPTPAVEEKAASS